MRPNEHRRGPADAEEGILRQDHFRARREQEIQPSWNAFNEANSFRPAQPRERTVRDVLAVGFRQKHKILGTFILVSLLGGFWIAGRPSEYESEMKILVRRGRAEEVATAQQQQTREMVSRLDRPEVNTEAHILTSRELALQVITRSPAVRQSFLDEPGGGVADKLRSWLGLAPRMEEEVSDDALADEFLGRLTVAPLGESNVIRVSFVSETPEAATESLALLSQAYLDKHLAVHRNSGSVEVFAREADRHEALVMSLKDRLAALTNSRSVVNVELEKNSVVTQVLQLESELQQKQAMIVGLERRLENLTRESERTPERRTTALRTSPLLLERLRGDLNALEMQRIELESKFLPDYGPVVQIKEQIEGTKEAIRAAEAAPPVEQVTDRDPTHDLMAADIARTRADLAGERAMVQELRQSITDLRGRSIDLDSLDRVRARLERDASAAEQSFLVYQQRAEEARISEELDRQRILNVAVAESPSRPQDPVGLKKSLLAVGLLALAGFMALGVGVVADMLDPTFRRPEELEDRLGVPVLASMPRV